MKIAMIITATMLMGATLFAADMEKKSETTVDTSKNPITGTVTTKKKHTKKKKGDNREQTSEVTEKTKVHTDGKVEQTTKTETKTEEKH